MHTNPGKYHSGNPSTTPTRFRIAACDPVIGTPSVVITLSPTAFLPTVRPLNIPSQNAPYPHTRTKKIARVGPDPRNRPERRQKRHQRPDRHQARQH